jgi:hypothetical protein
MAVYTIIDDPQSKSTNESSGSPGESTSGSPGETPGDSPVDNNSGGFNILFLLPLFFVLILIIIYVMKKKSYK